MFRNKTTEQKAADNQVQSISFTGSVQESFPGKYEVTIEYKNGTKTAPSYLSAYTLYDEYKDFLPKEYLDEISSEVNQMRARKPW
jgi:DNA/RNA endonuclease YhcR with UshA esterase domain